MPSSIDTRTWGRASPAHLTNRRPLIVLVVVGLLVAAVLAPRLRLPETVPPLTIDNPTAYDVLVEASSPQDPGWEPVAIAEAHHSTTQPGVVDEGATWNLRFTSQGIVLTGYQVTRQQLADHHWSYTLPADVASRLATQGAPPSP
jgi:hypothetical protein